MANRQRNMQLKIRVNEEERKLIEQKMAQLPTSQLGAYIRKMAIDGYIIYTDIKNIKQYVGELQTIGKNISYIEYTAAKQGKSWKAQLQNTIDIHL